MNGKILEEFIRLASKLYCNKVFASNDAMKKAKGVKKNTYLLIKHGLILYLLL